MIPLRSCTIVEQQSASDSDKSSEIIENQDVTEKQITEDENNKSEDEAVIIEHQEVVEAAKAVESGNSNQNSEGQKQSVIESNDDEEEIIIEAVRVEDEKPVDDQKTSLPTSPQSVITTTEDSNDVIIQAVRVESKETTDAANDDNEQQDSKSISSVSSGSICMLLVTKNFNL